MCRLKIKAQLLLIAYLTSASSGFYNASSTPATDTDVSKQRHGKNHWLSNLLSFYLYMNFQHLRRGLLRKAKPSAFAFSFSFLVSQIEHNFYAQNSYCMLKMENSDGA